MEMLIVLFLIWLLFLSVNGFTPNQRKWFLRRDGNRCMFHEYDGKKWKRCKNTDNLQVH